MLEQTVKQGTTYELKKEEQIDHILEPPYIAQFTKFSRAEDGYILETNFDEAGIEYTAAHTVQDFKKNHLPLWTPDQLSMITSLKPGDSLYGVDKMAYREMSRGKKAIIISLIRREEGKKNCFIRVAQD